MKKRIALLLSCALLVGTSMSVYAACVTHVTNEVVQFIRVSNVKEWYACLSQASISCHR